MRAQWADLIMLRGLGDHAVLRLPSRPLLPMIAAAPPGEHENAVGVRQAEERIVLELAFEANRVEVHVADVLELGPLPREIRAQQHVGRPAPATDQDRLAVDEELPAA